MKELSDKREVLRKGEEIGRRWGVDEVLFMEERKLRWRMVETAKRERAKGRRDVVTNRELRWKGEDGAGTRIREGGWEGRK